MPKKNPRKGTAMRGNAAQKAVAEALQRMGYTVHVAVRSRYHSNDVLNVFDIVAVRKWRMPLFVQVTDVTNPKSRGNISHRKKKVAALDIHIPSDDKYDNDAAEDIPGSHVQVWATNMREMTAEIWTLLREDQGKTQNIYWRKTHDEFPLTEE